MPPSHSAMLVGVRRGLRVFGQQESNWFLAWRYINHVRSIIADNTILVTEHGWADFMTNTGGSAPSLLGSAHLTALRGRCHLDCRLASSSCYYAVLNSTDTHDIATNSHVSGPAIVSVSKGQYLQLSGCGDWVLAR